ncbi:hypothetical protein ACQCVE_05955 [Metabacillus sp. 113a]|uniref:hypothetical protein n=1 Tax=Metabacillus sp. 113a TaxID=3404706 RepID=UPI003CFB69AA
MKTIKDICEKIWKLEEDFNLFDIKIKGIKVWEIVRFTVFVRIAKELELYGQGEYPEISTVKQIKNAQMFIFNAIKKNPFSNSYSGDVMVLDHERKVKVNNEYIDIYTKDLLDNMDPNEFFVVEYPYLNKHYSSTKDPNRSYMDYFYIESAIKFPFNLFLFNNQERETIDKLQTLFKTTFDINFDFRRMFYKKIFIFKLKYNFFTNILIKKKPKLLYLVVSYSNMPLIAAAKDYGIEVIEIQHGVITPFHLGYSFPVDKEKVNYFPDKLYVFGDYWRDSVSYPISKENIISYGFPYMQQRIEAYKGYSKTKKQVLVISQGTIGDTLSEFTYNSARMLSDYQFIYKLHPREYNQWRTLYPFLIKAEKLPNFTVVDNNIKNLYEYFSESEFLIGVYSTAIFEGLSLNCKTILVRLPGIEYMNDLIKNKHVIAVNNTNELIKALNNYSDNVTFNEKYFFN